jgi:hypothetical protein
MALIESPPSSKKLSLGLISVSAIPRIRPKRLRSFVSFADSGWFCPLCITSSGLGSMSTPLLTMTSAGLSFNASCISSGSRTAMSPSLLSGFPRNAVTMRSSTTSTRSMAGELMHLESKLAMIRKPFSSSVHTSMSAYVLNLSASRAASASSAGRKALAGASSTLAFPIQSSSSLGCRTRPVRRSHAWRASLLRRRMFCRPRCSCGICWTV